MISEIMHNPLTLGFFFLLFLTANVLENFYREQERNLIFNEQAKKYGALWHDVQFIGWAVVFGYVLFLLFGVNWQAARVIILFASCWWILYDGSLNLLRERNFFFQSTQTTSNLEKYATPAVKIIFLACSVLLFIIF